GGRGRRMKPDWITSQIWGISKWLLCLWTFSYLWGLLSLLTPTDIYLHDSPRFGTFATLGVLLLTYALATAVLTGGDVFDFRAEFGDHLLKDTIKDVVLRWLLGALTIVAFVVISTILDHPSTTLTIIRWLIGKEEPTQFFILLI